MKLREIQTDSQEPLLIVMLRKLLSQGKTVWTDGRIANMQVKSVGACTLDRPRIFDQEEYHGRAYQIVCYEGIGPTITLPEADSEWDLVHHGSDWKLKKI